MEPFNNNMLSRKDSTHRYIRIKEQKQTFTYQPLGGYRSWYNRAIQNNNKCE